MQDLNAVDLKGAINMIKGSAVSMGMEIVNWWKKFQKREKKY